MSASTDDGELLPPSENTNEWVITVSQDDGTIEQHRELASSVRWAWVEATHREGVDGSDITNVEYVGPYDPLAE